MWCNDPDGAFDIRCRNLGCEDWCKDNSNCSLQRKDQEMFILVKKQIDTETIETADVVIQISKDRKTFNVLKHRHFNADKEYHISQLVHILVRYLCL